jgi:hypothetical protein
MGDETLMTIARELVAVVRKNVTIDWTVRENVRANLRVIVKRILRKYGYPPDLQEKATQTVLEQAEVLSGGWATELPSENVLNSASAPDGQTLWNQQVASSVLDRRSPEVWRTRAKERTNLAQRRTGWCGGIRQNAPERWRFGSPFCPRRTFWNGVLAEGEKLKSNILR